MDAFLRSQADWIEVNTAAWRTLAAPGEGPLSAPIPEPGKPGWILFRGERLRIRSAWTPARRVSVAHEPGMGIEIALPEAWAENDAEQRGRRALHRWFEGILTTEAEALVVSHGAPHGLIPERIGFGAPRTRWGSCSSRGTLRLNRRLIGAPPAVFRYVVLHELAHLRFHHHRAPFWELVALLDPDWQAHASWLRRYGVALS